MGAISSARVLHTFAHSYRNTPLYNLTLTPSYIQIQPGPAIWTRICYKIKGRFHLRNNMADDLHISFPY